MTTDRGKSDGGDCRRDVIMNIKIFVWRTRSERGVQADLKTFNLLRSHDDDEKHHNVTESLFKSRPLIAKDLKGPSRDDVMN